MGGYEQSYPGKVKQLDGILENTTLDEFFGNHFAGSLCINVDRLKLID